MVVFFMSGSSTLRLLHSDTRRWHNSASCVGHHRCVELPMPMCFQKPGSASESTSPRRRAQTDFLFLKTMLKLIDFWENTPFSGKQVSWK
jgi:hypothetical protein